MTQHWCTCCVGSPATLPGNHGKGCTPLRLNRPVMGGSGRHGTDTSGAAPADIPAVELSS
jgi:hypothetical protein